MQQRASQAAVDGIGDAAAASLAAGPASSADGQASLSAGPAVAVGAAGPRVRPLSAIQRERMDTKQQVRDVVVSLLMLSEWRHREPRIVVQAALQEMKKAGNVLWGAHTVYTRYRTLVDSFLKFDFEVCKAVVASSLDV